MVAEATFKLSSPDLVLYRFTAEISQNALLPTLLTNVANEPDHLKPEARHTFQESLEVPPLAYPFPTPAFASIQACS